MNLRRIRVASGIIVVFLFVVVFLGDPNIALRLSTKLTYLQFVPSVTKFFLYAGGTASIGFLLIIILTLIFGRIYCSMCCPLGIFQDVLNAFWKMLSGKKRTYIYFKSNPLLRNAILVITLISAITGSLFFVNLVDPYSLFGRIIYFFVRPIVYLINNLGSDLLEYFDIYTWPAIPLGAKETLSLWTLMPSLFLLILIVVLTFFCGRQYCGLICPVGTILGYVSKFSLFQIQLDWGKCNLCRKCQKQCKTSCINPKEKRIDLSRCILCFNCLNICHRDAIHLKLKPVLGMGVPPSSDKRQFLKGGLLYCLSVVSVSFPMRSFAHLRFKGKSNSIITPPGSKGVHFFSEKCTACHLCLNVCEENVLQPALFEYGVSGLSQPIMDFNRGKCAYECNSCGQVCPTGAINFLPLKSKQLTQIGTVELIQDRCIVYQKKRDCGACAEVCPTHAVHTKIKNNVAYPKIIIDSCIGCGACQKVCPTRPKSIIINPNEVHSIAQEPIYSNPIKPKHHTSKTGRREFPF